MKKVIQFTKLLQHPSRNAAGNTPVKPEPESDRTTLNKFCSSLLSPENEYRFRGFPDAYCREYGLNLEQIHAVTDLDVSHLLNLGCSVENIEVLTNIYNLYFLELFCQQTGKTEDEISTLLHDT